MAEDKNGKRVTVSGAHVFIKDGQSLEDALKGRGEHRQTANYADLLRQDKETRPDEVDFYSGEPKREQCERQDVDEGSAAPSKNVMKMVKTLAGKTKGT